MRVITTVAEARQAVEEPRHGLAVAAAPCELRQKNYCMRRAAAGNAASDTAYAGVVAADGEPRPAASLPVGAVARVDGAHDLRAALEPLLSGGQPDECHVLRGWPCPRAAGPPRYDCAHRDLWVGEALVLQLTSRAKNLWPILAALERGGWSDSVDDPLDGDGKHGLAKRLHDAVRQLNTRQKQPGIRFSCDGKLRRVSWHLHAADHGESRTHKKRRCRRRHGARS